MAKKKSAAKVSAAPPVAKQSLDDFIANWSDDDDDKETVVKVQSKKSLNGHSKVTNGNAKAQNGHKKAAPVVERKKSQNGHKKVLTKRNSALVGINVHHVEFYKSRTHLVLTQIK